VPLHAAGIYESGQDVCCSDYVVSSYAPTLTALARAQGSPVAIKRSQLRLALFSATHTAVSGLPPLASVDAELDAIAATAARAGVSVVRHSASRDATAARVAERLAAAHAVHIACHGLHDAPDPLASGFCLRDGRLAVAQLMRLDLARAFLAFLSACETARAQPDLAIHLAAAMLCVGFRSVVATMWCVSSFPARASIFTRSAGR
jgi:CHAT domain-containing protein